MQRDDPTPRARAVLPRRQVTAASTRELSPDARWLLVVTVPKGYDAAASSGKLTRYVDRIRLSRNSRTSARDVGRNAPAPQSLLLLDLVAHTQTIRSTLDGSARHPRRSAQGDPHAKNADRGRQRQAAKAEDTRQKNKAESGHGRTPKCAACASSPMPRTAAAAASSGAATAANAADPAARDRQQGSLDRQRRFRRVMRWCRSSACTDDAWINWNFNEFGWLNDNRTLWYVSRGNRLCAALHQAAGRQGARADARASSKSRDPQLSRRRPLVLRARQRGGAVQPTTSIACRLGGGELQRVTQLPGHGRLHACRPTARSCWSLHSSPYVPPQLAIVAADGSGTPRELTDTRSAAVQGADTGSRRKSCRCRRRMSRARSRRSTTSRQTMTSRIDSIRR